METTTSLVSREMVRGSLRSMCGYAASRQELTMDEISGLIKHTYILPWSLAYDTDGMDSRDVVNLLMDEVTVNVTRLVRDIAQGRHGYYDTESNDLTAEEWDVIASDVCRAVRRVLSDDVLSCLRVEWLGRLGADIADTVGMPMAMLDDICIAGELWLRSSCGELCEALDRLQKSAMEYVVRVYKEA